MSNQVEDMEEFNSIVSKGSRSARSTKTDLSIAESAADPKERPLSDNTRMWAVYGEKNFSACEKAVDEIPPGQYTIKTSEQLGVFFQKVDTNLDDLIHLPDSASERVFAEIESFWQKEEHFRRLGFLWKRGILTWGPPGSGKTSCLQVISQRVIAKGGISVYVENPSVAAAGLKILRHIEPHRPILVMLEDVDAIIDKYGESTLLALMDGELQIDNVVFIATTNYPEKLDRRFINRPSRFDLVEKIGMPSVDSRRQFLKVKNPRLIGSAQELEEWVKITDGFSIAHMKELIVSVEVFSVSLEAAVKRLRTMMDAKVSSTQSDTKFGFN